MPNENAVAGASGNEAVVEETANPEVGTTVPQPGTKPVGESWIPEDLRSHKSLTKFKTPAELGKAYVNLESLMGSRIAIPGENATPEEKAAFRTKLGVPDKAEAYPDPDKVEGMPDLDSTLVTNFKQAAHNAGLGPAQAKFLMNWWVGLEAAKLSHQAQEGERRKTEGMKGLRTAWGAAADQNVGLVQRLVDETGDEDLTEALDRTGAGNEPAVLKWMARLSRTFVENDLMEASSLTTGVNQALADIETTKNAAAADRKHPYRDSSHPGHKAEVARMAALYQIAYPDTPFEVSV